MQRRLAGGLARRVFAAKSHTVGKPAGQTVLHYLSDLNRLHTSQMATACSRPRCAVRAFLGADSGLDTSARRAYDLPIQ